MLPPELLVLAQVCTKSFVGWGFAPDVTGGAYSSPPDPLLVYEVGPPVKGKEGEKEGGEGVPECPNSELASLPNVRITEKMQPSILRDQELYPCTPLSASPSDLHYSDS